MLPNFAGVRYGKFVCLHSHCKDRHQRDFLQALELEPKRVWGQQSGKKSETKATPAAGPEPLDVPDTEAPQYPVDALGPILGGAAKALHEEVQAPLALCGQSVLTATAMSAQGHLNVQPPHGRPHPISLYGVTTGGSGDRKSATDREAMAPILAHERELEQTAAEQRKDYADEVTTYEEARKAAIAKTKKQGQTAMLKALRELEQPGEPPPMPYLIAEDPTVEGLYRSFKEGYPSQGCFTDEAGLLIGGHALNQENFLKTISRLSKLWDGGSFDRTRGGDDRGKLHGRRMSLHWLVQPMVAAELFEKRIAEAQGFFTRCLLAMPETLAGSRKYRATRVHNRPEMGRYYAAVTQLLRAPLPLDQDGRGLLPSTLTLTDEAKARYAQFFDYYEEKNGPQGELHYLQPFVSRIAEQGLRIAAVLHVIEHGTQAGAIPRSTLDNGFRLAEFSLQEWGRLKQQAAVSVDVRNAKGLLEWAQEQALAEDGQRYVYSRQIQRLGPNPTRDKAARDAAITTLVEYGWFIPVKGGKILDNAARRHVWVVVRDA
jgi:putative DNA primase/helicase